MKFGTVANPQQVAAMASVADAYCRQAGIARGKDQKDIAAKIMALHAIGVRNQMTCSRH